MTSDSSASGLIAAGNFIVDHVKLIDTWPSQDALASILGQESSNGGGPYNVAKDLAKLFPDVGEKPFPLAAAGLVGDDPDGRWILEDCAAHGIDTTHLKVAQEAPTSYTDVMTVESTGRRTFFHQRGANARFDGAAIDFASVSSRIFYLGYLLLLDSLDEMDDKGRTGAADLLERASGHGLMTVVDLVSEESDRFRDIIGPSLPFADVLLTNEFEAGRLSGIDLGEFSPKSGTAAAREILEMGVRKLVVIHAPEGAVAVAGDGTVCHAGSVRIPESEIRGAVGAGDAFAAGVLYGLHEDQDLDRCLHTGACVAASCLQHPTTSGGILPLEQCLALGARWGFREFT